MTAPLNNNNYLNLFAFIISWSLLAESGRDRGPDDNYLWRGINQLSQLYEDRDDFNYFTPATFTFLLSQVVLLFQGIFAMVQMMPGYRASAMVQDGVSHWFLTYSFSALAWSLFAFGIGGDDRRGGRDEENAGSLLHAIVSVILMGVATSSIGMIVYNQANKVVSDLTEDGYWMIQFPFTISFGWFFCLFFIDLNDMIYSLGVSNNVMIVVGIVSLILFIAVGSLLVHFNIFDSMRPNYVIPAVFAWVMLGIAIGHRDERNDRNNNEEEGSNGILVTIIAATGLVIVSAVVGMSIYTRNNELATYSEEGDNYKEVEATGYTAPEESPSATA
jgi:hypothetical protein